MSPKGTAALKAGMTKVGGGFEPAAGFLNPKYFEEGLVIAATYIDSYVDKKWKSTNHRFLLTQDLTVGVNEGDKKKPKIVEKTFKAGESVIMNGSGQINKSLALVPKGTAIVIEYQGMKPIEKGEFKGTEAHQFELYAAKTQPAAASDDSEEEESDDNGEAVPF